MMAKETGVKIREAGVVGAGGAGFPTHVKYGSQAEIVIVNGAECEPLLRTDQQLAATDPELLIKGLAAAMKAAGASEGIVALKAKYRAAVSALQPHLKKNMRIGILRDIYPAGDEPITIWLTTGRRVPPGGLPIDIGVIVNNVQTMMNIGRAVGGEAVTTRTLTVTGAVAHPKTVTVPLGTPFYEVLELAGSPPNSEIAVINGGPVMGTVVADFLQPVTKTTGGLIALPADHPLIRQKLMLSQRVLQQARAVCEQCSMCTELCPRHLIGHEISPHLLVRAVNYNYVGNPQMLTSALTCSECGLCEVYACPVGISPRRINIALKAELRAKGIKYEGRLGKEDPMAEYRLIPSHRVAQRMGLAPWYEQEAPLIAGIHDAEEVTLKMKQHIGAAALPVVAEGDRVNKGALVGEIPEGVLGARIHASISGTAVKVTADEVVIRKGAGSK